MFGMYIKLSTRNSIRYVNLITTVVGGHRRSQEVKKCSSLDIWISSLNKTLAIISREIFFACTLIINSIMYKHDIISPDVVAKVLLRDENSDIQWNSLLDLLWPPPTVVIKFTYPMLWLVDIWIYMQKKIVSLGVAINF